LAGSRWAGLTWVGLSIRFFFISFSFACFGSLAPPGFGCRLVCALHEHAVHTLRRLDKNVKNTNFYEIDMKGVKIFQRVEIPHGRG